MDIYAIVRGIMETDLLANGVVLSPLGVTKERLRGYFDIAIAGLTGRKIHAMYIYIDEILDTTSATTDEQAFDIWFDRIYADFTS